MRVNRFHYLPEEGLSTFDLVLSYTGGEALQQLSNAWVPGEWLRCTEVWTRLSIVLTCRGMIFGPTSPISAHTLQIGRKPWRHFSSSLHDRGGISDSSSQERCTHRTFRGRRISSSRAIFRRTTTPPSTAHHG